MPIPFACPCGKSYAVPDEFAGRRTKCKACGAPLTVPTGPPADDFEVVEGPPPPPKPKPIKAAFAPPAAPAVAPDDEPPPKRRKKARLQAMTRDEEKELARRLNETEARRTRQIRGVAFMVLGGVVLLGDVAVVGYFDDFEKLDQFLSGNLSFFLTVTAVVGVAGVGKGALTLLTGQTDD